MRKFTRIPRNDRKRTARAQDLARYTQRAIKQGVTR